MGGGIAYDITLSAANFVKRTVGVDVAAKGTSKAAANEEMASGTKVVAEEVETLAHVEVPAGVDIAVETKGKSATYEVSTGAGVTEKVRSSNTIA